MELLPSMCKHALSAGVKYYYTGKPCKYGHVSKRLASTRECYECKTANRDKWDKENYQQALVRKRRAGAKQYALKPHLAAARAIKRRGLIQQATPNFANTEAIREIYMKARGQGMHVDHIVPINNKNVCGLHVEWNLQLLNPVHNLIKGNKYESE